MENNDLTIPNDSILENARIIARVLPLCPELKLFLLEEDYPKDPVSEHEFNANIASPPYWAFCWASGQALARFILDNPSLVRDKVILDFGAGSGVAGIAAAKADAKKVVACDVDPAARKAIRANAKLNQVEVQTWGEMVFPNRDFEFDVILAGDVCYDAKNAKLLTTLADNCLVLLGDSRLKEFPEDIFIPKARFRIKTVPDIFEIEEYNHIVIYQSASNNRTQHIGAEK